MRAARFFGLMLASSSLLATTASAEQLFEYRLRNFGLASNRATCESAMQDIAEKFTQQSGITPFAAGCKGDDVVRSPFLNGVISYFAESRVSSLSSADSFNGVDDPGGYTSLESCEASLPTRIEQFITIYDQEPMVAYCYRIYESQQRYAARIDAIGESDIQGRTSGFTFFGRPVGEASAVLASLRAAAELKFPGRVMDASFDGRMAYARATVRYYNNIRYYMNNLDEIKWKTAEACLASLDELKAIFQSFTEEPAALFCSMDGISGIRSNIATFTQDIGSADNYRWYKAPTSYDSREDCLANRGTLSNDRVAGAICTDTVPSVMHLILKLN